MLSPIVLVYFVYLRYYLILIGLLIIYDGLKQSSLLDPNLVSILFLYRYSPYLFLCFFLSRKQLRPLQLGRFEVLVLSLQLTH